MNDFKTLPFILLSTVMFLWWINSRLIREKSKHFLNVSALLSYLNVVVVLYAIGLLTFSSPIESETLGWNNLGFSLFYDRLTVVFLMIIALLGMVVYRFSRSYFENDPLQRRFIGNIIGILASIQLLVSSGNIAMLYLFWIITSFILHDLLLHFKNRKKARHVARKKFMLARLADFTLLVAFILIYQDFQTGNIATITNELISTRFELSFELQLAAILIVLTAILKTAQVPFHGWLVEVMEAPTPVSALLHAGLIGVGPFLIFRFSPLVSAVSGAQIILLCFGFITAVFGALVYVNQTSIKTLLAYSSVGHMGFTLTLCGLGLYPAALLHFSAHSFYKAHAFLSSGSQLEKEERYAYGAKAKRSGSASQILGVGIVALSLLSYALFQNQIGNWSTNQTLLNFFILLTVSTLIMQAFSLNSSLKTKLTLVGVALFSGFSFFFFEALFHKILVHSLPNQLTNTTTQIVSLVVFALLILLTLVVLIFTQLSQTNRFENFKVHLRNGLYINTWINKYFGIHNK